MTPHNVPWATPAPASLPDSGSVRTWLHAADLTARLQDSGSLANPPPPSAGVPKGPAEPAGHSTARPSLAELLAPLAASESVHLRGQPGLRFERGGLWYELPCYQFAGPVGGDDPLRIGIFATLHGDEPESGLGLVRFLHSLLQRPALAQGFVIHAYPVCNPTGYEDRTRCARGGKDLNREFWRDSTEPEVRLLEQEIRQHQFHGIISLHCDDTSHGLYGFLSSSQTGDVLSESLLQPALRAAEEFLPRNYDPQIDGFHARGGILSACYEGVLRAPAGLAQPPFEITFETPQRAPVSHQIEAFNAALLTILEEYRQLLAHAPNL